MKPLKKRIQIALGGKKRKMKASVNGSKNNKNYPSYSKKYNPQKATPADSVNMVKDSIIDVSSGNSWALLDTVIRIYYKDLTDSTLNKYKHVIKSFVARVGANKISDISLTDYYSENGFTDKSIKPDIEKYLLDIGVSKHRLFWRQNKRVKLPGTGEKPKKLLYVEIGFH